MATLLFKFVFLDNGSPAAALTSTELTGGDAPTVNISKTTLAGGVVSSEVSGGALTYDSYTRSWGYRLASADLATYLYVGMATTSYADAAQADVHALGIVVPDELVSSRAEAGDEMGIVDGTITEDKYDLETAYPFTATGAEAMYALSTMVDDYLGNQSDYRFDSVVEQQFRDAMMLAPTAGSPAAGSVDEHLDELLTRVPDAAPGAEGGLPVLDANLTVDGNVTYQNGETNTVPTVLAAIKSVTDSIDLTDIDYVTSQQAGAISMIRGATYSATLTGLTISADWATLTLRCKRKANTDDGKDEIAIVVTNGGDVGDGLTILGGAAVASPITAADASLTVDQGAGTVAVWVSDEATNYLGVTANGVWHLREVDDDEDTTQVAAGTFNLALI